MKDFVGKRKKPNIKKSKLYERVRKLPESRRRKRQNRYLEVLNAIAREKSGVYKIMLDSIREDLTPKSAYSSIAKALIQVAKRNGVNFSTALRRQVQTKRGVRSHVSYPEYTKWKEENMRLRLVNNELFIEKKTDRPL